MRRVIVKLRMPLALLLVFAGWCWFWHWYFPYSPTYTPSTGLQQQPHGQAGSIIEVEYIANDGQSIRLTNSEFAGFMRSHSQIKWDVINNRRIGEDSPDDRDWQELREFAGESFDMHDRAFWEPFVRRWQEKRRRNQQAAGGQRAANNEDDPPALFPHGSSLSADGLFFANGCDLPFEEIPKGKGIDVIIEEVATGRHVATIRDQQYISVAPGGRIAAKVDASRQVENGPQHFTVWDLSTCQPILQEKIAPTVGVGISFSQDGRFIFLSCDRNSYGDTPDSVMWWNARGQLIGTAVHAREMVLLESGHKVATFSSGTNALSSGPARPRLVQFWDVETGALLGTWRAEKGDSCLITSLCSGSRDERYVSVNADYFRESKTWDFRELLQGRSPVKRLIDGSESEVRTILLDSRAGQALIDVPGRSSEFSANGRWFATIDNESVVRIWELPLRKPWGRILGFAAITTLACVLMCLTMRWLVWRTIAR